MERGGAAGQRGRQYTFTGVAVGSYAYSVANSGDYAAKSGTVTVRSGDVTETVTLAANTHKLTFTGLPEGAALTVMSGDQTLTPDADGVYTRRGRDVHLHGDASAMMTSPAP